MSSTKLLRNRMIKWSSYIAHTPKRKYPARSSRVAHRFDVFWKKAVLFLLILLIWMGIGLSPGWSIVLTLTSMGLLSRYSLTSRSIKLFRGGKMLWQAMRGQPEAAAFNHRFFALSVVGLILLVLANVLEGPWTWYYGVLGTLNILMAFLALWFRGSIPPQDQN